jgi:hypothetical protein
MLPLLGWALIALAALTCVGFSSDFPATLLVVALLLGSGIALLTAELFLKRRQTEEGKNSQ